jgi:tetratricopeptide (TPR) repeat protein
MITRLQQTLSVAIVLACVQASAWASCNHREIGRHLSSGRLDLGYSASVECEAIDPKEMFAEPMLRGQYFATAQILIAQGKIDLAKERISLAKNLGSNVMIPLDHLEDTTAGFLLEQTGRKQDAIDFYRRIAKPYALVRLAALYAADGQIRAATDAITVALKGEPGDPAAHAVFGSILEATNPSLALTEYRRAVELSEKGNPTIIPLVYMDVRRAKDGIQRIR